MSVLCFITDESAIVDHQWGSYNDMPKTSHWSLSVHQKEGEKEPYKIHPTSFYCCTRHIAHEDELKCFEISSSDIQGMGCMVYYVWGSSLVFTFDPPN